MALPSQARLTGHYAQGVWGSDNVTIADINGDGRPEFLHLQSAGQLRSSIYRGWKGLGIDERDAALHCLTACTEDGTVLWQDGAPWAHEEPFVGHGGSFVLAEDIDADGRVEVVVIRPADIAVLDGATGHMKASLPLPADNFSILNSAQLGEPAKGRQLIVKVNDAAYAPWEYGNPTLFLNADLTPYAPALGVRGAGHNIVARDIDGDGRDELFIGYSLYDHDLRELWRLDLGPGFDYVEDHADAIVVSDVNGDGKLEVQYSGSEDFFVADLSGHILWKTHAGHSQASAEGPWGPKGEKRIIMSEKNRGIWGLDAAGTVLWNRTDINGYALSPVRWSRAKDRESWCLFLHTLRPFEETPFLSDPSWTKGLWPCLIDGDGTLHEVLPWNDAYSWPSRRIRSRRSYDAGVQFLPRAMDIDGDGLDEIIVVDRRNVWFFHSGEK